MICPHCQVSLRQKERPNLRCSKCRKEFAFDPKDNPLMLHDVLVRKLVEKLGDGGRLRYTGTQLWYAAARKTLRLDARGRPFGCGPVFAIGVALVSAILVQGNFASGNYLTAAVFTIPLFVLAVLTVKWLRSKHVKKVEPRLSVARFTGDVVGRWQATYGEAPRGLMDDRGFQAPVVPPEPALAVLCPDRTVLASLHANLVPERLAVALVASSSQVPPGVPVLVVHDASLRGCLLVGTVRAALPGRVVVDAGLHPRRIVAAKGSIRLRTRPLTDQEVATLRALGTLSDSELRWLAQGWWSPVAAVRPAALITKIQLTVGRALQRDPARAAAAAVGFMTWPA